MPRHLLVLLALAGGLGRLLTPGAAQDVPADRVTTMPALGQTWIEIGGAIYGAQPDEAGPIGGGVGYRRVFTTGDYRVATADDLRVALRDAKPGQVVYVEPGAEIDCTGLVLAETLVLEIPAGVTLAGDRGHDGSPGPLIYSEAFATQPLIRALGAGVRVTGLRLRGPDPRPRADHHQRSFNAARGDTTAQYAYYGKFPVSDGILTTSDRLEVDNCELSGWSHAAVFLAGGADHHIHHCYLHHNQYEGLGYGVCLGSGGKLTALIERNVFDYNRCSIAGTGAPGNAYEACHNVQLTHARAQAFDMHGGRARGDGTDIAGDWMKIHHNQFRVTSLPAVVFTGVPREAADITANWFFVAQPAAAVQQPWATGNLNCLDNAYGADQPVVIAR
jgi:hypothetical protein